MIGGETSKGSLIPKYDGTLNDSPKQIRNEEIYVLYYNWIKIIIFIIYPNYILVWRTDIYASKCIPVIPTPHLIIKPVSTHDILLLILTSWYYDDDDDDDDYYH